MSYVSHPIAGMKEAHNKAPTSGARRFRLITTFSRRSRLSAKAVSWTECSEWSNTGSSSEALYWCLYAFSFFAWVTATPVEMSARDHARELAYLWVSGFFVSVLIVLGVGAKAVSAWRKEKKDR